MFLGIGDRSRLILTGLAALVISAAVISIAGMVLGSARELLAVIPGLMVLLPASINMRGSISGVFASRLSSSMHRGEFEVDLREGEILGNNLRASFVITVLIAFVLGIFAYAVARLAALEVLGVLDLVLISMISGVVSGVVVMAITILVSVASYRYGLDLDMIAAPTVTTSGDIVTLPVLLLSAFLVILLPPGIRLALVAAALLLVAATVVYALQRTEEVRDVVRETTSLLIPLCFVGTLAGVTYTVSLDSLIAFAALLILIPPFAGGLGSIGGILASRLSTGMHMGEINPTLLPERGVVHQFIITYFYTLILLPLVAGIAHGGALLLGLNSPGLGVLVAISALAGVAIMTLVNGVAYVTATLSFRYGLDPDNFGIPVITSLIDLIGATALIAVITLVL
ncbi:magnesium transporter MgtE [Methanoculleus sp. FWC-SCC1]|uniref:Magnesium transporter MgtE n=1 Tax=Methanoculleus frigidifontis TaxID=2584085 RepID=A0ABT8M945_9EURY|nr:magnesium transporter [Methanoculleus sp. FWC-SCC1]MDN7024436.1 magnesium transporter MgtE [Methanoculleus sp. FWC-SCC1]